MYRRSSAILGICVLIISAFVSPAGDVSASQSGSYNINIWTTTPSGQSVYDVCYTLVNYSNLGCDANRDGAIFFEAIPAGTYSVQPSYPNGSTYNVQPFTIVVSAGSTNFYATAQSSSTATGVQNIKIWTVDSNNGSSVFDICYQLHLQSSPWSNVGCDENRDGGVTFDAVPYGEYVVFASYPNGSTHSVEPFLMYVNSYNADFTAWAVPGSSNSTDVLLLTRDPKTGASLTDVCFEFVGFSNIGCDENKDGRVSFADMPEGTYTIRQTKWPASYSKMNDYEVTIKKPKANGPLTILLSQSEQQANDGQTNYSVVFYDSGTGDLIMDPTNCARFSVTGQTPISNRGCDENIIDGQADFMAVNITQQGWSSHHTVDVYPQCGYVFDEFNGFTIVGDHTVIYWAALRYIGGNC